ncbi:MAG: response regulator, partial [Desulfobacterales bacterium]|nr:response regulator [Desulfobacterales bacterium]
MSKKILVVDDEEDILELVRYNLASEGYYITCAASGEEAVKLTGSKPFDLVVLDLMLPGISGIDVARKLRADQKTRHIPIIMLTARSEESDIVKGLKLADDYITKPFSPKILCARVSALFRRKGEYSENEFINRGDITIYPGHRRVDVSGKPVELSFSEFQILMVLCKR